MGILRSFVELGSRLRIFRGDDDRQADERRQRHLTFESLEARRVLAADVHFGAVYFEEATGDDSEPDVIEVTFEGGVEGTQLTQIVIDGDKLGNDQLNSGDVFFDIEDGGLGAFEAVGVEIVSAEGFQITGFTVVDGGTEIVIDVVGFDAGESLVFSLDADEANFVNPGTGAFDQTPVVEGAEFQRSRITGTFEAQHYETLELEATFWDDFDDNFASAAAQAGTTLDLPPDKYVDDDDLTDRTAGAVAVAPQVPLPAGLSGYVYHDRDDDGNRDGGEEGIGNVTIQVFSVSTIDGSTIVETTETDQNGYWEVTNLVAGTYRVVEVEQPDPFLDGKDTPGTINGVTVGQSVVPDGEELINITLAGGENGIEYNFGEIMPGSISGTVHADPEGDCEIGEDDILLEGVRIDLLDENGNLLDFTFTDENGNYTFEGLAPGNYQVFEHQPADYYDGDDHAGTAGGTPDGLDTISGIQLGPGENAENYDFCELLPGSISGTVHLDPEGDCEIGENDVMLEGVRIDLLDANGNLLDTTFTDENGFYIFEDLAPGTYQVFEHQPTEYLDGDDHVGTAGGSWDGVDTLSNIHLAAGENAEQYNFCEHPYVELSGYVYHDASNDGVFDANEQGIGGVTLKLLDENGNSLGITTTTSTNPANLGYYEFTGLEPGTYGVMEVHPAGWIDGLDTPGTRGGTADNPGDMITGAVLNPGQNGTQYNFGELLPGSIQGTVRSDTDGDCETHEDSAPIEGVVIELLNDDGVVIATTETDANGDYSFENLAPGTYSVREQQPDGFFNGDQMIGSGGGEILEIDWTGEIEIGSNQHVVDYDFCEMPPGEISGFVFQDGETLQTPDGQVPADIAALRDGQLTSDDTRISGVTLELRNGVTGEPIDASAALPGTYPSGPIRTTTDANGYYEFTGLPPGNYAVYEVHPDGYVDYVDTVGTLGGLAVNPNSGINPFVLDQLTVDPADDAIIRIALFPGQSSENNNFSEVRVTPPPTFIPDPDPDPDPRLLTPPLPDAPTPVPPPPPVIPYNPPPPLQGGSAHGYTWHLSVIDAGQPRDPDVQQDVLVQLTGVRFDAFAWKGEDLEGSEWTLEGDDDELRSIVFGSPEATPVTGDFNGDGIWEVGVFLKGEWFIDVNGNGVWDEGDLWAKLGTDGDLPVTGDWDGDGKTDIGIFGPAWSGDPMAVLRDPGLPDPHNQHRPAMTAKWKNLPPQPGDATSGGRTMKLTSQGKLRSDLIDHVFHYGTAGDVPITGDWNGEGIETIGVFRDGQWKIDLDGDGRLTSRDAKLTYGQTDDKPVIGDWNGDGIDDIGIFRDGTWIIDTNGNRQLDANDRVFELGGPGDLPVVGDFNGDGIDEPGVYHPVRR